MATAVNVKEFVEKISSTDEQSKVDFNTISEDEFNGFIESFNEQNESDKINYIGLLIDGADEDSLTGLNYQKFFNFPEIKELVSKCI